MCENYEALSRAFKRLRVLYAIYLIAAVAALVVYFVNRWATLAVLGVCLIYYLFVVRPASRSYSRSFVHICAQATLNRHLSQAVHSAEPVLNIGEIRRTSLMPANDNKGGIVCHEGGSGQYHGHHVRLGDITFAHSYPTPTGKTRHQFTSGLYIIAELGQDSALDCRILFANAAEKGSVNQMLRDNTGLERLAGASGEGGDWTFICANGNRALPDNSFMQALSRLDKAVGGWAAVCVQGDRIHIYIIDRLLGQRVNSRYAPDARVEQADMIPELDEALALADCVI